MKYEPIGTKFKEKQMKMDYKEIGFVLLKSMHRWDTCANMLCMLFFMAKSSTQM